MSQRYGMRIGEKEYGKALYWADGIAEYLINQYPNKKKFVCAAGITPSGRVHFGNFRDGSTAFAVACALQNKGKKAEFIYSWDNYDRFRKVPKDIDQSYEEHVGKALIDIPSPVDPSRSYAEVYQQEFEEALRNFNITVSYRYQADMYTSGTYDTYILEALKKRKEIADILLSYMTDKGKANKNIVDAEYRESFYPISIYSRFSKKDATEILSYDGDKTIRYRCKITNKEEEIDITKIRIAKLNWKIDWAVRWKHEDVCFEPGGSDHAAPGGSYDVSSRIAEEIFGITPPVFIEYGFVGLQGLGTKMSGSKGQTTSPKSLLAIYEPALLLWMYLRRLPSQTFSLAFDTEVYRQYDEMDKAYANNASSMFFRNTKKEGSGVEKRIVETLKKIYPKHSYKNPIPFRQIVGLAQIVQWDEGKLFELLKATKLSFDMRSVKSRLPKAKTWVTKYNTDSLITLRTAVNTTIWNSMDKKNQEYIQSLHNYIQQNKKVGVSQLEEYIYSLPKEVCPDEQELKRAQRTLFKYIYQLLIDKDSGPRLSTFLWAVPSDTLLRLLPSK